MSVPQPVSSYEYKNDYLYIIVRQTPEQGPRSWILCCGVSIKQFDPFCRDSHGICSNPAFRGLQLLRTDLAAFAIEKGARLGRTGYGECMLMAPKGDGWYRESLTLDNVGPKTAKEFMNYAVRDLLRKVLTVAAPTAAIPARLPNPPQLARWIKTLERND